MITQNKIISLAIIGLVIGGIVGVWVNSEQVSDLIFYGAVGVILGGRLGYILFYDLANYLADPLNIFKIWQGGMSFHGGCIGVSLHDCLSRFLG